MKLRLAILSNGALNVNRTPTTLVMSILGKCVDLAGFKRYHSNIWGPR